MSNPRYIWLAHSGEYDDHIVWGVFASVESWWEDRLPDFKETCPNVVMVSSAWRDDISFRPACHCPRVWNPNAHWNVRKDHGKYVQTPVGEMQHPHKGWFNSDYLSREVVQGSIPLVEFKQTTPSDGVYEADACSHCGRDLDTPHHDDCWYLINFPVPPYADPKICTWRKAGEKCTEVADDGDDQFCAEHLEQVLSVRREREAS